MSLPDLVVVALLLVFALSGIRHGVIWELFIVVGLLIGFALTYAFHGALMDLVMHISPIGWQRQWVGGVVFLTRERSNVRAWGIAPITKGIIKGHLVQRDFAALRKENR